MEISEFELKIQSYVDGELAPREMLELEEALKDSAEGRETLEALIQVKRTLQENEPIALLETPRELYWSGIERQILGLKKESAPVLRVQVETLWSQIWRWTAPISAAGLVVAILMIVFTHPEALRDPSISNPSISIASENSTLLKEPESYQARIEEASETAVSSEEFSTFEYTASGMTVVWLEHKN